MNVGRVMWFDLLSFPGVVQVCVFVSDCEQYDKRSCPVLDYFSISNTKSAPRVYDGRLIRVRFVYTVFLWVILS